MDLSPAPEALTQSATRESRPAPQAWRKAYAEMRANYTVSLPVASDKGTASAAARPPVTQIPTSSNEMPPL